LLLSSLVGCANRRSEECILGRAGGTGDEFVGVRGALGRNSSGTTGPICPYVAQTDGRSISLSSY
jgi:hypothetical protein